MALMGPITADLAADEVGGHSGQSIVAKLRPAKFDRQVLSLDIAGFAQLPAKRDQRRSSRAGRAEAEKANHRHRLLLRAGGERPRDSCAAEHQEIAPVQSFTSSLR